MEWFKCNYDAAYDQHTGQVKGGLIVRDGQRLP